MTSILHPPRPREILALSYLKEEIRLIVRWLLQKARRYRTNPMHIAYAYHYTAAVLQPMS